MKQLVNIRTGEVVQVGHISSGRNSSRTLAQAFSYIGLALNNPGTNYVLTDHAVRDRIVTVPRAANDQLAAEIVRIIDQTKIVGLELTRAGGSVSLSYQPYVPLDQVIKEWRNGK